MYRGLIGYTPGYFYMQKVDLNNCKQIHLQVYNYFTIVYVFCLHVYKVYTNVNKICLQVYKSVCMAIYQHVYKFVFIVYEKCIQSINVYKNVYKFFIKISFLLDIEFNTIF